MASSDKYLRPLRLDDLVTLERLSGHVGTRSFDLALDVIDASGQLSGQVETTNVWVQTIAGVMCSALPEWLRILLTPAC